VIVIGASIKLCWCQTWQQQQQEFARTTAGSAAVS